MLSKVEQCSTLLGSNSNLKHRQILPIYRIARDERHPVKTILARSVLGLGRDTTGCRFCFVHTAGFHRLFLTTTLWHTSKPIRRGSRKSTPAIFRRRCATSSSSATSSFTRTKKPHSLCGKRSSAYFLHCADYSSFSLAFCFTSCGISPSATIRSTSILRRKKRPPFRRQTPPGAWHAGIAM